MKKASVSVIIPTYNRSHYISRTLESFVRQNYPKELFEIIVVNNNSTDDTSEVLDEWRDRYPNLIRVFCELKQGVHFARNFAATRSLGEYLYYTDDDMIADENLLLNLVNVFVNNTGLGCASGRIIPLWEVPPPIWVEKNMKNYLLSLNDMGKETIIRDNDFCVYSCHQMIRRSVFFDSGGFNPENTDGVWIGDGETGLNAKIMELGYKFAYVGSSCIKHIIPPQRMTQSYFNKRLANQGNCDSYTDYRKYHFGYMKLIYKCLKYQGCVFYYFIRTLLGYFKFGKAFRVRKDFAKTFYYHNRMKYNFRLLYSNRWRKMVLRKDWLI